MRTLLFVVTLLLMSASSLSHADTAFTRFYCVFDNGGVITSVPPQPNWRLKVDVVHVDDTGNITTNHTEVDRFHTETACRDAAAVFNSK